LIFEIFINPRRMKICRNLSLSDEISTIEEWFKKCPPQRGRIQWQDGRSAKETAKHWINGIPQPFKNLFKGFKFELHLCSPEYVSEFDGLRGNGRNHDLLILALDQYENSIVISVESKVDESFGPTVGDYQKDIKKKKDKNISTQADTRISNLKTALMPSIPDSEFIKVRYQLLTAVAGTLSEAKKQKANSAFFIVQTFITNELDPVKHQINQSDLDCIVNLLSNGRFKTIKDGTLLGPLRVKGNRFIPDIVDLWIGKYSLRIV
jgi:hypothetical protein